MQLSLEPSPVQDSVASKGPAFLCREAQHFDDPPMASDQTAGHGFCGTPSQHMCQVSCIYGLGPPQAFKHLLHLLLILHLEVHQEVGDVFIPQKEISQL